MELLTLPLPTRGILPNYPDSQLPDGYAAELQDMFYDAGTLVTRGPLGQTTQVTYVGSTPMHGFMANERVADTSWTLAVQGTDGILRYIVQSTTFGTSSSGSTTTKARFRDKTPFGNREIAYTYADNNHDTSSVTTRFWSGGSKSDYTTGTITTTLNSTTVTGSGTSWSANVEVGMYLYSQDIYVGRVANVASNTSLTLDAAARVVTAGANYNISSLRPAAHIYATGVATVASGSTVVVGAGTSWKSINDTLTWQLFRLRDGYVVGTVSTFNTDGSITLTGGANTALNAEPYFLAGQGTTTPISAASTELYAGRAWWGGFSSVGVYRNVEVSGLTLAASSTNHYESLELFFKIPGSRPGDSIQRVFNVGVGLLVLCKYGTWLVTGKTASSFEVVKLQEDGLRCARAADSLGELVAWVGDRGIYVFTGGQIKDITQTEGGSWADGKMSNGDFTFLTIFGRFIVINFGSSATPTNEPAYVYDLNHGAWYRWLGAHFRGTENYGVAGSVSRIYVAGGTNSTGAFWVQYSDLFFELAENDNVSAYASNQYGPCPILETKEYDAGNFYAEKMFKDIVFDYGRGAATANAPVVTGYLYGPSSNGTATTLGTSTTREVQTIPVNKRGRRFKVRIASPTLTTATSRMRLTLYNLGVRVRNANDERSRGTSA